MQHYAAFLRGVGPTNAQMPALRAAAAKRLADEGEAEAIVEVLARAAAELRRK